MNSNVRKRLLEIARSNANALDGNTKRYKGGILPKYGRQQMTTYRQYFKSHYPESLRKHLGGQPLPKTGNLRYGFLQKAQDRVNLDWRKLQGQKKLKAYQNAENNLRETSSLTLAQRQEIIDKYKKLAKKNQYRKGWILEDREIPWHNRAVSVGRRVARTIGGPRGDEYRANNRNNSFGVPLNRNGREMLKRAHERRLSGQKLTNSQMDLMSEYYQGVQKLRL